MKPFPFSTVGFDLDGTLIDTHEDLAAALNHALALAGRPSVSAETTRGLIGGGTAKLLERGLLATGGPVEESRFADLRDALIAYYEDHIAVHSRPFAGGVAMLDTLRERGVKCVIVTNKLERLATKLIEALGLSSRFATIIGGDTLGPGRSKPAPDLLLEMVRRCGGGSAAYVGDSSFDTRSALAAGLPCIVVSFGFNDYPVHELGATVVDHFDQLPDALVELANGCSTGRT